VGGLLNGFPLLVRVASDTDLAAKARADGADLLFTDETGTPLEAEVEKFDPATGELVAWVKLNTLSGGGATIYLYYGNPSATSAQSASAVWDSDYLAVWHLAEDPGAAGTNGILDSSGNAIDITDNGGMDAGDQVSGVAGDGFDFDGVNDFLCLDTGGFCTGGDSRSEFDEGFSERTVSLWSRSDDTSRRQVLYEEGAGGNGFNLYVEGGQLYAGAWGGVVANTFLQAPLSGGAWRHVVSRFSGSGEFSLWVDGVQQDVATAIGDVGPHDGDDAIGARGNATRYHTGNQGGEGDYFQGSIDEVRVSATALSPGWILTEYDNQRPASTMLSWGAEETAP